MPDYKNKKIKALHIIHGFGSGGAETWLLHVAKYLQAHPELGLHIDFLATGGEPAVFDDEVLLTGSKIFYVKYSLGSFLSFRNFFSSLLRKEEYDVIHNHQDFVSGWHFLAGLGRLPAKRISHLHNPYQFVHNYVTNPMRWFAFKVGRVLTYSLCTSITGTSDSVMNEYGYDKWPYKYKRVRPAYCGFNVERFAYDQHAKEHFCIEQQWDEKCKIALFIGRIDSEKNDVSKNQKNPLFALQLAKKILHFNSNWKFVFVGLKGEVGVHIEQEIEAEGLSNNIRFLGVRKDVPTLLSAADVLLFPSLWEGLGMIAVEAQANGLPVLASDSIPTEAVVISELVTLKSLNDSVESWSKSLQEIAESVLHRNNFKEIIKQSVFSIESSVENLIKLYNGKGLN